MSRWKRLFTRRPVVVAALLVTVAVAVYVWQVTRTRLPFVLTYCLKYAELKPLESQPQASSTFSCLATKTLKIPAIYYGIWNSEPTNSVLGYPPLELAYPSMQPWATVPWFEQFKTHKLEIRLQGVTDQTVKESFGMRFLGTPKPIKVSQSLYGLNRFDIAGGWTSVLLIPVEDEPRLHIGCAGEISEKVTPTNTLCVSTTRTDWKLGFQYEYPQDLLSRWVDIHRKVIALVDSFITTP